MPDYFSPDGPLASYLEKFEPRTGQKAMAEAVAEIIAGHDEELLADRARLLVVEAETGIGKTLAYLIPAVLCGQRVVVSTATLNLQDQIMNKEIPLLEQVFDREVPVVCIKGRQNYLCLYRWYQLRASLEISLIDDPEADAIGQWLRTTETGDRSELEWLSERSSLWPKVSSHSNQCLGGDCPEYSGCFVNLLRKKAGKANLLVVNHHLFFSDLALRRSGFGEVLPRYEGVIFDEAHHVENVATTFFGRSFSQFQLIDLLSDTERQVSVDLDPDMADRVLGTVRGLKQRTEEFVSIFPRQRGKFHLEELVRQLSRATWQAEVELLARGLQRLIDVLALCNSYGEGWATLERRADELRTTLLEIALADVAKNQWGDVYWYERRERSIVLSATPIHVAVHLQETLYSSVSWCIMTSATLSSGGNFAYMRERLGLQESVDFLRFPSPFNYTDQSITYVPELGFPEPAAAEFQLQACMRTLELLQVSRGRALVLCTSFRGMNAMAEYLEEHTNHTILVQGRGARSALLENFRSIRESVLVAVASFWEGVDIQGDSLSCVIIDKLPFEVPSDPVVQARIQAVNEQGGNAFFDFQVPRAVLTLRQGVGRLMRSSDDRGAIAILDVRLFTKRYGGRFRKSLPPSPIVRYLEPVAEFFEAESST